MCYIIKLGRRASNHPYEFVFQTHSDSGKYTKNTRTEIDTAAPTFQATNRVGYISEIPHPVLRNIMSNIYSVTDRSPDKLISRQAGESFNARRRQCRPIRRQRCRRPSTVAASRLFIVENESTKGTLPTTSKFHSPNTQKSETGIRYPKGKDTFKLLMISKLYNIKGQKWISKPNISILL